MARASQSLAVAGLACCLFLAGCLQVTGPESGDQGNQAPLQPEVTAPVAASPQVDALVSSNPKTKGKWFEELPPSWSQEENKRVWTAYHELVAQGKSAVPVLIANLERKEFSTCISTAVPYCPCSVGDMCQMAIGDILDPIGVRYKARSNAKGKVLMGYSYFDTAFHPKGAAQEWWKQNQDKTVEEIREMIRSWYIEREVSFGFEDDEQRKRILEEIERRYRDRRTRRRTPGPMLPQPRDVSG